MLGRKCAVTGIFTLINSVDSKHSIENLPIAGFKPWTSGVKSDGSTTCSTIAALHFIIGLCLRMVVGAWLAEWYHAEL